MSKGSIPTDPLPFGYTGQKILSVFDRLPIDGQIILLLVDVEELDYQETSDILGIPVGRVIATLNRTRARFEEQLAMTLSRTGAPGSPRNSDPRWKPDIRKLLKTAVESIPLPANLGTIVVARIQSELLGRPVNLRLIKSKSNKYPPKKFLLLLVILLFIVVDPIFPNT